MVVDSVSVDPSCDWDEGAIERALSQARTIEEWDKEAALQLRAQARTAKAKLDGSSEGTLEPYDPMRLMARVLYHYKGAITDADFARMDYRRFFGYVRELDFILEDEQKATKGEQSNNPGEVATALSDLPRPQEYQGEVMKLI